MEMKTGGKQDGNTSRGLRHGDCVCSSPVSPSLDLDSGAAGPSDAQVDPQTQTIFPEKLSDPEI